MKERNWSNIVGVVAFLMLIVYLAVTQSGCTDTLPQGDTMKTGETVKTPKQYEEYCKERDDYNLCPEKDDE